jgi:hypothetical protein
LVLVGGFLAQPAVASKINIKTTGAIIFMAV